MTDTPAQAAAALVRALEPAAIYRKASPLMDTTHDSIVKIYRDAIVTLLDPPTPAATVADVEAEMRLQASPSTEIGGGPYTAAWRDRVIAWADRLHAAQAAQDARDDAVQAIAEEMKETATLKEGGDWTTEHARYWANRTLHWIARLEAAMEASHE